MNWCHMLPAKNRLAGILNSRSPAHAESEPRSLRIAAIIVFLLLFGFAAVIAAEIAHEFRRAAQSRELLSQSFETRIQTQRLFSLLQDAETGQRGFVITGKVVFPAPR